MTAEPDTAENAPRTRARAAVALAFLLASCGVEDHHLVERAEAIYWHEGTRYSAAVRAGDSMLIRRIPGDYSFKMEIVTDATEGAWYECEWQTDEWVGIRSGGWCKIHIGSIDDLRTGDWNHGKFGSGKTRRIN